MSAPKTILIAALSGRALAASAKRAGYTPLVVDCFGDTDTRTLAHDFKCLPATVRSGFNKHELIKALDDLATNAPAPPEGLVLGTGFEDEPDIMTALAESFQLIGNSPQVVANVKDPAILFPLLRDLGIPHPDTATTPPSDHNGWLKKKTGGSGGIHITPCPKSPRTSARCYYQRHENGTPISIAGVVSSQGFAIGICRQWLNPSPKAPFRFGGLASPVDFDPDTEARMIDVVVELTRKFDLKGFVSFDFVVTGSDVLLLEINPRPTAALDVLDDHAGTMFKAHIAACHADDPANVLAPTDAPNAAPRPIGTRAIGYLYADAAPLTVPDISWPSWAIDRPAPGTRIKRRQPLITATAEAKDPHTAEQLCRTRLGQLETMLYGPAR